MSGKGPLTKTMSVPATLTRLNGYAPAAIAVNEKLAVVAASTTIKAGDLLAYDSNGFLVQAIAVGTTVGSAITKSGQTYVAGIALEEITTDSTGYSNLPGEAQFLRNSIKIAVPTHDTVIKLRVVGIAGTITDGTEFVPTVAGSTVTAASMEVGTGYKLCRVKEDATNGFYAVCKNSAQQEFVYDQLVPSQTNSTVYPYVIGRIAAAARVTSGGLI